MIIEIFYFIEFDIKINNRLFNYNWVVTKVYLSFINNIKPRYFKFIFWIFKILLSNIILMSLLINLKPVKSNKVDINIC